MGRGDVEVVDQENAQVCQSSGGAKRSSSIGSTNQQKSFIPVLMASKNENASSSATTPLLSKARKPLGPLQTAQSSPIIKKLADKATPKKEGKAQERTPSLKTDRDSLTKQIVGKSKTSGVPGTPQNSPSKLTERKSLIGKNKKAISKPTSDALKLQDDADSISYWKELAESRREALESALQENYELHQRVEKLEADKIELEALVKEGEKLATLIQDWSNDHDESGIGEDAVVEEEEKQ